jgi:hypothetical protein
MAFYRRLGDGRFESTVHTRGPWDPDSQHAGPPAALLATAILAIARPGLRLARITFDISKPVPVAPLEVTAAITREGRSVVEAQAAIEPFMRCRALLIRTEADVAPAVPDIVEIGQLADALPGPFLPIAWEPGYHTAIEARFAKGSFLERGPAQGWLRMMMPLIEDEQITPVQRVLTAADSGNGISNVLDFQTHVFINAELTVHLQRYPTGDWVGMHSSTTVEPDGIGLTSTTLHDVDGPIGRAAQSLYIARRT